MKGWKLDWREEHSGTAFDLQENAHIHYWMDGGKEWRSWERRDESSALQWHCAYAAHHCTFLCLWPWMRQSGCHSGRSLSSRCQPLLRPHIPIHTAYHFCYCNLQIAAANDRKSSRTEENWKTRFIRPLSAVSVSWSQEDIRGASIALRRFMPRFMDRYPPFRLAESFCAHIRSPASPSSIFHLWYLYDSLDLLSYSHLAYLPISVSCSIRLKERLITRSAPFMDFAAYCCVTHLALLYSMKCL